LASDFGSAPASPAFVGLAITIAVALLGPDRDPFDRMLIARR